MRVDLLRAHGTRSRYDAGCRCSMCRAALSDYNRRYYEENRQSVMDAVRRRKEADPEKKQLADRRYYHAHREQMEAYRAVNRERRAEQARAWKTDNADRCRWYRMEHAAEYAATNRSYKARKRNAQGTHDADDIAAQYQRQRGRCYWCGVKVISYDVDHVMPLALGGSNGPENLVIACPSCNRSKGAKHPQEFAGILC